VLLLNKRLMAAGPVATAFTIDALQRTYEGRVVMVAEAASGR
jgi:ABC-type Mn2+/Zn2+ transport system ATPase subunit